MPIDIRMICFALRRSTIVIMLMFCGTLLAGDVAIVSSGDARPYQEARDSAKDRLQRAGHTVTTLLYSDLTTASITRLSRQNAVLTIGADAALGLRNKLSPNTLIVFCLASDASTLTAGDSHLMHGVLSEISPATQLVLMASAFPKARRLGVLYNSQSERSLRYLNDARQSLPQGWSLQAISVDTQVSPAKAIDALLELQVDVVWTIPDPEVYNNTMTRALLLAALRARVPVFGFSRAFVKAGALLGLGIDAHNQGSQAASLVNRLLKEPSANAVLEQPSFQIIINDIVAEKLSIDLPKSFYRQASEIIKPE